MEWFEHLAEGELRAAIDAVDGRITRLLDAGTEYGMSIEDIGAALSFPAIHLGPESDGGKPHPGFWKNVRKELFLLVCTQDSKYDELRKKLAAKANEGTVVLVGLISAAIGAVLGFAEACLSPFVALGLLAMLRVGKEAWCQTMAQTIQECG